jgi:hypothetical protein
MGAVFFEDLFDPVRILSKREIGALGVDFSARNRCAVADLVEARPEVVHRIEEDARRACRRRRVKPDLVNVVWSLALGVDHVRPWVFDGERSDDVFEIADVVLRTLESAPWAVEGMGRCHRFPRCRACAPSPASATNWKMTSL